jgi:hypothetical protein
VLSLLDSTILSFKTTFSWNTFDSHHSRPIKQRFSAQTCSYLSFEDQTQSMCFLCKIIYFVLLICYLSLSLSIVICKISASTFLQTLHQQLSRNIIHPGCYHWTPTLLISFTSNEYMSNHTCRSPCSYLSRHTLVIGSPHFVHSTTFWKSSKVIGYPSQPFVVQIQFIFSKCVGGTSIPGPDIGASDVFELPKMAVCWGPIY